VEGGSGAVAGQLDGAVATGGTYAYPWHPDIEDANAGGAQAQQQSLPAYDYSGSQRISANALIRVTEIGVMQVRVLAGGGVRRLGGTDYQPTSNNEPELYGIESSVDPLVTYGALADVGVTDRTAIRLQLRGTTVFQGEQQLLGPQGAAAVLPSVTQTFASAIIGLRFSVGRGQ